MKSPIRLALACAGLAAACGATAQPAINETRDQIDRWIETRKLISEEQSDWAVERAILVETRTLLRNEVERLDTALASLGDTATDADRKREALTAEKDRLSVATEVVRGNLAALESRIKEIVKRLPEPLAERLAPVLRRLPDDPENSAQGIGERVLNIVAILDQADQFNNTVNRVSSVETMENGKEVQVDTLYWGLAMAYYVDASGEHAGIRTPGPEGWTSTVIPGAGPQIKKLLDVYEGIGEIQFITVPASIQQ